MSVQLESPPTSPHVPFAGSDGAPLVELLERYRAAGTVPFSGPGHKLGAGAAPELLAVVGPELFASDVWLDTAGFDRALGVGRLLLSRQRLLQRQPRLPARHRRPRRRGRGRPGPAQVAAGGPDPDRG